MFKVNEIKSWAKKHGISVKKKGDGYVWFEEEGGVESDPSPLETVVFSIYNKITDGKYVEYQKSCRDVPQ